MFKILCFLYSGFFEGDNERNEVLVRVNPGIPLRYTLHGQQPVKVSIIDHLDNASLSYALLQVGKYRSDYSLNP